MVLRGGIIDKTVSLLERRETSGLGELVHLKRKVDYVLEMTERLEVAKQRIWHRPGGFQFGNPERGRVSLRWKVPSSLILNATV